MSNTDSIPNLSFNFSLSDSLEDDNETFKFDLFLMTREIKQITASLKHVTLLPPQQRRTWVKDNQQLLHQFMSELSQDMLNILEDMSLDREVLHKTISCVTELRELISTLNGLMSSSTSSLTG